jgi:thioredoxin reductase
MIDAVIAGAGPGGLSAALCLGRAGRRTLVLDGGPWRNIASGEIHNFLSRDGAEPAEVRASALAQLSRYPTVKVEPEPAESADGEPGHFQITFGGGRRIDARRLLLATGVEDVTPEIPGLSERWGQSVVHCPYCHGWERMGLLTGLLALDEWSVPQVIHVARFSDDVTLYANGEFPLASEQRDLLKSRQVTVCEEPIARLEGPGTSLERLVFADGSTAACQVLYCHAPTRQHSDLAARLGCRFNDDGSVEVNEFGQTSRPGVFAVGDMARQAAFPFPARQVVMAAAQGVLAGVVIDQELLYND